LYKKALAKQHTYYGLLAIRRQWKIHCIFREVEIHNVWNTGAKGTEWPNYMLESNKETSADHVLKGIATNG
jgi:hypothetical protein